MHRKHSSYPKDVSLDSYCRSRVHVHVHVQAHVCSNLDNTVELGTSVTETLLARAQGREVSRRLRHVLVVQAHVDFA